MNHYELIFIVNPQLSKDSKLFDKCKEQISSISGTLHRAEDIGLRDLAYQIDDCSKGHYFLLNFECLPNNLQEIDPPSSYEVLARGQLNPLFRLPTGQNNLSPR